MKTEQIIVTEPGKGRAVNPYSGDHNAVGREYEFNRTNPSRDCIDTKGNALPVRDEPYLCKETSCWYDIEKNVFHTDRYRTETKGKRLVAVYQLIDVAVNGEKDCPACGFEYDSATHRQECVECDNSTPVNEAKESVEQAADKYANSVKPNEKGEYYHHMAIDNAFIAGAEWRATHPIENKEGVKSVEDIIREIIHDVEVDIQSCEYLGVNEKEIQTLRNSFLKLTDALETAQFTPIEQGKRMVDVEAVIEVINRSKGGDGKIHWPNQLVKQLKLIQTTNNIL